MRFLFPHHFSTIRTNKQTYKHTNIQQSSFNNIDIYILKVKNKTIETSINRDFTVNFYNL